MTKFENNRLILKRKKGKATRKSLQLRYAIKKGWSTQKNLWRNIADNS